MRIFSRKRGATLCRRSAAGMAALPTQHLGHWPLTDHGVSIEILSGHKTAPSEERRELCSDKKVDEQHNTSLAVWDVASPLVIGRSSKMKVGAKCSAGCQLTGHEIEIHEPTGQTISRGGLGADPWPGTSGLYWTELDFPTPPTTGTHTWTVTAVHGNARSNFTFVTVLPPEHSLTIRVREKSTQTALADVELRLGVYRACSDYRGLAKIEVAKGSYDFSAWKAGYEHFSTTLDVTDTLTVDMELALVPEPAQPYWM
jgi:hypothetical protein